MAPGSDYTVEKEREEFCCARGGDGGGGIKTASEVRVLTLGEGVRNINALGSAVKHTFTH